MNRFDSYKDSGIEWIGQIPSHWKVTRLKFLGKAIGGMTYSPKDVVGEKDEGVLVLRSSNIQNGQLDLTNNVYIKSQIPLKLRLKIGDILICSRNGSQRLIGKNILIDERMEGKTFGAFMMVFRSDNYSFLYNFFNSPIFKSQSALFLTSTINQLTSGTINNFVIAYPESTDEQLAIAKYLDQKTTEIDNLISKKERLIELLEEEKTAVINQAVTKGLDPNVPMKDSAIKGLGDIPQNWKRILFKRIIDKIKDGTHGTFKRVDRGYLFLSAKNVQNNKLSIGENESQISEESYKEITKNGFPKKNDLLITCVGTIGRAMVYKEKESIAFQRSVTFLRLNQFNANPDFYKYYVQSDYFQNVLISLAKTSAQSGVYMSDLSNSACLLVPLEEQDAIVEFLDKKIKKFESVKDKLYTEINYLKEYKIALISEVVTGKVDVRDEVLVN